MSQNENNTRRQSLSNSSNASQDYNTTSPKMSSNNNTNYRYSSSAYTQARHYASPEESDAVLPVFTTPTHMYLKQELNSQRYNTPSPKQQYASSPVQKQYSPTQQQQQNYNGTNNGTSNGYYEQKTAYTPGSPSNSTHSQQYGRTRGESSPVRPSMDHFGMNSMENEIKKMNSGNRQQQQQTYNNRTTYTATSSHRPATPTNTTPPSSLTPQQDMLLAQLVDMGFTLEASRIAMIASGGTNLQEILDILVQDAKAENQIPTQQQQQQQPSSFKPDPPTRPTNGYQPTSSAPPPPPPSRPTEPLKTSPTNNNDDDDDEEEDPRLEKEREEKFKKEQEERRREYLEQLKREKPTPPAPAPRPPPKTAQPKTTSDPATFFADKERKEGNYLFNKNQFPEAEAAYTLAIDALPPGHSELVLLSNNRAAARLKQNKYHECLADCSVAIDIARKQISMQSGDTATWKAQMIKALHRKACALEGLRLFEAAIGVYEEYVRMDGSRSAQVTQGIMRCQQALLNTKKQPPPQPPRPAANNGPTWKPANDMSAFPDIDFNMFIPKQTPEQKANLEEINNSKAVKEMRDREKKKEAEEAERLSKEDKVSAQISVWKTGKDRNLRALLGSLELILWPGVQWKGVTMGELLEPRKCKIAYMKAIAKVHPDKLPANATVEQRMLASGIFTALNQAWDIFRKENNL